MGLWGAIQKLGNSFFFKLLNIKMNFQINLYLQEKQQTDDFSYNSCDVIYELSKGHHRHLMSITASQLLQPFLLRLNILQKLTHEVKNHNYLNIQFSISIVSTAEKARLFPS